MLDYQDTIKSNPQLLGTGARARYRGVMKLRQWANDYVHDCKLDGEMPTERGMQKHLEYMAADLGSEVEENYDEEDLADMIGEVMAGWGMK